MARRRDDDGDGINDDGSMDDPSTLQWGAPLPPPPGQQDNFEDPPFGTNDPAPRASTPVNPNSSEELARQNSMYGVGGTASQNPGGGATFDPNTGQWSTPAGAGGGGGADAALRAQIAQWASMPGADPSLAADPDYWVRAINSRGGLNSGNTQYWQDASVGDKAFFRNPGRESQGGGGVTAGGGASGPDSGSALRNALIQMISQRSGPNAQRDALYGRLNALMDKYSQPVDENDPDIARSSDAYQGDVQRSLAGFREQAAERAHAEGVGTGAFDSQLGNAMQAGGRATGKYKTDLIDRERSARRAALSGALGQTIGLLGETDNNAQSGFASSLSGLLGQQGIDNQDDQFYDDLTSKMSSHANDLDTILQELLIGR